MIATLGAFLMGLESEITKEATLMAKLLRPRILLSEQNHRKLNSIQNGSFKKREWKKILYEKQGVPDNFVSDSFLQDLKKNVNLKRYNLMDVIVASSVLTKQFASIVILISLFVFFDSSLRSEVHLPLLFVGTFFFTTSLYLLSVFVLPKTNMYLEIKRTSIFLVAGFSMSPILRTLTETISTDTIYSMVFVMMLVHLSLYNYGIPVAIVSKPISLNAAFFASVCLASRLGTSYHVFLFLTLSIDLFVLFGIIYSTLPSMFVKNILSIILASVSMLMFSYTFLPIYCVLYALLLFFVNLVCPIGFYKMQAYKENIYGPWDEAIIDQTNQTVHLPILPATKTTPATSPTTNQHLSLLQNGVSL